MIKTVIFDLGKVLFNWDPQRSAEMLLAQNPSFNSHVYKITQTPFWNLFDLGFIERHELIDHFKSQYPENDLNLFLDQVMEDLTPLEMGVELLTKIKEKGYRLYLLSNLSPLFHQYLAQRYPIFDQFDGLLFSYQIQKIKPDFHVFKHLLEKFSLNPEECFFIDDLDVNIYAAKKMGIEGIIFVPNPETILTIEIKLVLI